MVVVRAERMVPATLLGRVAVLKAQLELPSELTIFDAVTTAEPCAAWRATSVQMPVWPEEAAAQVVQAK